MIKLAIDGDGKTVSFPVSGKVYSRQAVEIAAQIFAARAEVSLGVDGDALEIELRSRRAAAAPADLEKLAGEFLNELLNQEYRFLVSRFNQKISGLVLTQALISARGGEEPPKAPAEEQTPEFKAEVARLLREADDEIQRTMPKKLPPQGNPLPPAKEEMGV